jgi:hypothetical protein
MFLVVNIFQFLVMKTLDFFAMNSQLYAGSEILFCIAQIPVLD